MLAIEPADTSDKHKDLSLIVIMSAAIIPRVSPSFIVRDAQNSNTFSRDNNITKFSMVNHATTLY